MKNPCVRCGRGKGLGKGSAQEEEVGEAAAIREGDPRGGQRCLRLLERSRPFGFCRTVFNLESQGQHLDFVEFFRRVETSTSLWREFSKSWGFKSKLSSRQLHVFISCLFLTQTQERQNWQRNPAAKQPRVVRIVKHGGFCSSRGAALPSSSSTGGMKCLLT